MSLVKWIAIGLLVLPVAEIAAFVIIASFIGFFWTVALALLTSLAGVLLLRAFGIANLVRVRGEMTDRGFRAVGLDMPGLGPVAGALLLVLPGFISDVIGVALLVPQIRRWFAATIGRASRPAASREQSTIDLDPADWQREPDRALTDRRKPPPEQM